MLMAVSRAPLAKLAAYRQRMGWTFPWASSAGSDFNADFNIWFSEAQQRDGGIEYRSEEHTSEQSLMRISYAVFCLKKKNTTHLTTSAGKQLIAGHTHKRNMTQSEK